MNKQFNVVFMGTPDFAVPSLKALKEGSVDMVMVHAPEAEKKEPFDVAVSDIDHDGSTVQTYKYDLRDLELKAKEAALKLKEAELELMKAQQKQKQ